MEIKDKSDLEKVLSENSNKLIALRFHADWCAPCKALENIINDIKNDNVLFVDVNVDDAEEDFVAESNIRNIPTILFFKNGLQIDRFTGMIGREALENKIKENLEK